ncbi:unnamed protein product [Clonostachys rosea]|uniref:GST C-terminal domain-containing protein n=1 Tax=Bionectria ochroleuca TaxID=29856 RepID=A0ABY6UAG0_BIOOC|nr:unnamed protein product [Clonostachys rosea]
MAFGTLFTTAENSRSIAIKVIAKAHKLELNMVYAELGNPSIEHLEVNKLGKIPTFVGEGGFVLSECIAVALYFTSQDENTTLLGKNKEEYASIVSWMSYFNSEILIPLADWFGPLLGKAPYNREYVENRSKATLRAIKVVEEHLGNCTFIVGEVLSLADIFCAGLLFRGFQFFFDKKWRQEHPNVTRWYEGITSQSIYSDVVPKLEVLEKPALTNKPPEKPFVPRQAAVLDVSDVKG